MNVISRTRSAGGMGLPDAMHRKIGPLVIVGDRSLGFFRVFGYGLWWKDRSRNRLYFSERTWIRPFDFAIGTYHFKFLGR